jgi:hypothetical protein
LRAFGVVFRHPLTQGPNGVPQTRLAHLVDPRALYALLCSLERRIMVRHKSGIRFSSESFF